MVPLIDFICIAHIELDAAGPLITLVDREWAYCAGHAATDHEWQTLDPPRPVHAIHQLTAPAGSTRDVAALHRRA
jgi:hypothetical protein